MKGEELTPLAKVLVSFFENPEDQKPDIKALARLLRAGEPLPQGIGAWLAEVLEPQLTGELACNWTLKPSYVGRYDKARHADEIEALIGPEIDAARKRGQNIENTIQQMVDESKIKKSERTVWTIWQKIKSGREWRALFAKAPYSEAARRAIAERLAKRKD